MLLETNNGHSVKIGNDYISGEKIRRDIDKIDPFVIQHAINKFEKEVNIQKIKKTLENLKDCIYESLTNIKFDNDKKRDAC